MYSSRLHPDTLISCNVCISIGYVHIYICAYIYIHSYIQALCTHEFIQVQINSTGCSLNILFFFPKILKYSGLWPSLFSLGVSVCTHTRQVEHQRCSRTGRVQKIQKILRKNTTPCRRDRKGLEVTLAKNNHKAF